LSYLDILDRHGLARTGGRIWAERWVEMVPNSARHAGGTVAATKDGELLLGFAAWRDNPAAASRALSALEKEIRDDWRGCLDKRLGEPVPLHLAKRPGELVRDLFTEEELFALKGMERLATFEEFELVARNWQRYAKDYFERNPSTLQATSTDNVIAYSRREEVKPSHDSYLDYLCRQSHMIKMAVEQYTRGLDVRISIADLRRHAYIVAGTGGGKTELLKVLAHQLAGTDAGVLVIDPHGALAEDVAHFEYFADNWRDRLVYLDASDHKARPCINPFDGLAESAVRDEAGELASALQELLEERDTTASGSTLNMRLMVKNCVRVLLRTSAPDLRELYRFMNDSDNGDLVDLGKRSENEMLASYFAADFVAKERGTTKTAVRARLQEILDGDRMHLFCGPATVDVEKCLDAGRVVVMNLGGVDAGTSEAVGRFMMARLFSMAKRRGAERAGERRPVFVIADEAHLYLSRSAGEILAQARKFGVHLIAAQQSVDQGNDPEVQKLLMTQSAVKLVGVTSQDAATRRAFANVLDMEPETLKRMQRLQFAYSVDGREAVIFKPRSDLVDDGKMSNKQWADVLQEQRARFYRKPGSIRRTTPSAKDEGQPPKRLFPDE
jgi:DNA helicase HerA-like ATPase